ncbi:hypothetical protein L1987_11359 [Smallanthus sonchifolius]|uniref:Uncharacterized protein n=1 Tax=Smallanthus sonchifolius TaxID=185202 RepID=A0ACB9JBK3_9ASTR|nr:hypothetical protein L1987_11359 [Smallanthus sonchifolius]
MGTLISVIGAVTLTFYRGPVVEDPSTNLHLAPRPFVFLSNHENWVLGCSLFAVASLCYSIWNIIQVGIVEKCPDIMTVASSSTLFGIFQSALLALIIERDPIAWRLELDMGLLPLGVPIAGMFGCIFFAQTFHYGSLMAAAITGIGYYTMMWGQVIEDKSRMAKADLLEARAPLLQQEEQV